MAMSKFFNKIKLNLTLFFHGLFHGLRGADTTMLSQVSGEDSDDQEISHKLEINSVYKMRRRIIEKMKKNAGL